MKNGCFLYSNPNFAKLIQSAIYFIAECRHSQMKCEIDKLHTNIHTIGFEGVFLVFISICS